MKHNLNYVNRPYYWRRGWSERVGSVVMQKLKVEYEIVPGTIVCLGGVVFQ